MRLADQIIALRRKPDKIHKYFVPFAEAVAQAVPFEISDDVGRIASAIKQSDARKLLAIHEHCRLPFERTWVEWQGPSTEFGGSDRAEAVDSRAPRPDRCGALFESLTDDNSAAQITMAWSHKATGVNVSPIAILIDWGGGGLPTDDLLKPSDPNELRKWFPQYKNDNDDDLRAIDRRATVTLNPHMRGWWDAVKARLPNVSDQKMVYDECLRDIKGEGGFCDGLIAAISARNLTAASAPEDVTSVNKTRRKLGRPPLLSFRTVRLSLSRTVERRRSEGQGNPMPLHMVRGHFKVRKSGIYWWAPFWRGDAAAGVVSRKGYEVVA